MIQNPKKKNAEVVVEHIIKRLCCAMIAYNEHLEMLKVFDGHRLTTYDIRCHASDSGRIVGQDGARFRGLRFIALAASAKFSYKINLNSLVPSIVGNKGEKFSKSEFNPDWPLAETEKLAQDICDATLEFESHAKIIMCGELGIVSVTTAIEESGELTDKIYEALQPLFDGVGAANGCRLTVDIGPGKPA